MAVPGLRAQNLCPQPSFELAPPSNAVTGTATLATTDDPYDIIKADFDEDGNLDLAVAELPSSTVSIWLGNGDGTFTQASDSPISIGGGPTHLHAVDFDGNATLDLVVLTRNGADLVVLGGDGNGGFSQVSSVDTGLSLPHRFALADFDGANGLDVAVAGSNFDNQYSVLLNNGSGGLAHASGSPYGMPDGADAWDIAAGSFTASGEMDLVINGFGNSDQHATYILEGNGDGSFDLHDTIAHGSMSSRRRELALADLDDDGIVEILVVRYESRANAGSPVSGDHRVVVLARDASFDWSVAATVAMGADPRDVAVADFNLDGNPDLAVANGAFTFAGNISFGDGTLTGFDSPSQYGAGGNPLTVAVGDLDNDGLPDFTIANQPSDSLTTYLNTCQVEPLPPEFSSDPLPRGTLDTGGVPVGGAGVAELVIFNTAEAAISEDLEVGACSISNDVAGVFSIAPAELTIPAEGSDVIEVTCQPGDTLEYDANLNCDDSNDPDAGALGWMLACRGVAPAATITPEPVEFGNVPVGETASEPVTVTNSGTADLEISGLGVNADPDLAYGLGDDPDNCSTATLAPGDACTFEVDYSPGSPGLHQAVVQVFSNADPSPAAAGLSGTGIAGVLAIDPAAIDFGDVDVGADSAVMTVNLDNAGDAALELLAPAAPAAPFEHTGGDCGAGAVLAPGERCTMEYRFSPDSTGPAQQSLSFGSDFGEVELVLQGRGVLGELEAAPAVVDFGEVEVGQASAGETVTLSNVGDGSLELETLPVAGDGFEHAGGDCGQGQVLAAGESCSLDFVFQPQTMGEAAQVFEAVASTNAVTFELQGMGLEALADLDLGALEFGTVAIGESDTRSIAVANNGNLALTINELSDPGMPFARVEDTPEGTDDCGSVPIQVEPQADCSLTYRFTPDAPEDFLGMVTMISNAGDSPHEFTLSGRGQVPFFPVPAMDGAGLIGLIAGMLVLAGWRLRSPDTPRA